MPLFSLQSQTDGVFHSFGVLDLLYLLAGERGINNEIVLGNKVYRLDSFQAHSNNEIATLTYRCALLGTDFLLSASTHQLSRISSVQFEDVQGNRDAILNYKIDAQLNIHFQENAAMNGITAILFG